LPQQERAAATRSKMEQKQKPCILLRSYMLLLYEKRETIIHFKTKSL